MNNFTGIGRVGKDAVIRQTPNGKAVAGWSVAIDTGFGDKKVTTWLDCSAWGDRFTKVAEYIKKGDRIGVSGEIGTREHDSKTYITLAVRDLTLLGDKRDGTAMGKPQGKAAAQPAGDFEDESIPF